MKRHHLIVALLLTFVLVVGGILLLIAGLKGKDTGLDTDTPNGQGVVSHSSAW